MCLVRFYRPSFFFLSSPSYELAVLYRIRKLFNGSLGEATKQLDITDQSPQIKNYNFLDNLKACIK